MGLPDLFDGPGLLPQSTPGAAVESDRSFGPDGETRKRQGKARAGGAHLNELTLARELAVMLARGRNPAICRADEVGEALQARGIRLGNWMGCLFNGGRWEDTGVRVKSKSASAHAREIRVWRLKDGDDERGRAPIDGEDGGD